MPGMTGMRGPRNPPVGRRLSSASLLCDVVTLLPFVTWLIVSIAAVAAYSQIQWFAPIACSVYSSLLCGVATYRLWRRTHVRAIIYLTISEGPETSQKAPLQCGREACLAAAFSLVALAWGITDAVAMAQVGRLRNSDLPQPCGGSCGNCSSDPHCTAWAATVTAAVPLVAVCPPARHHTSSESNATFSCVADAAWMFLTFGVSVLWLLFVVVRRRAPSPAVVAASGGRESPPTVMSLQAVSPPPSAPSSTSARPAGTQVV